MDAQGGQRLHSKGRSQRQAMTVCGWTALQRRRWRDPHSGQETVPADAALDRTGAVISAGVQELCCRVALDAGSFQRAAEVLLKAGNLRLSDEKLRQVVEAEGKRVGQAVETEQLLLEFEARDCVAQTPDGQATTRIYLGCDGVKVPVITDVEKGRRFAKAKERRRALARMPRWRRRGQRHRRLRRHRGADQGHKEVRTVTLYDQSREHRWVGVTRKDHRHAARLMRKGACLVKLRQAAERAAVVDGALWIGHRILDSGVGVKEVCLDFYHLSQNVHKARREAFGEDSAAGQEWAGRLLHTVRHEGYEALWQLLAGTLHAMRRPVARRAMERLMGYVSERRTMLRYVEFERRGWDIGSGPTESQCKALTRRVKGPGMRWNLCNAESVMQLEALYQSGAWERWWCTRHLLN